MKYTKTKEMPTDGDYIAVYEKDEYGEKFKCGYPINSGGVALEKDGIRPSYYLQVPISKWTPKRIGGYYINSKGNYCDNVGNSATHERENVGNSYTHEQAIVESKILKNRMMIGAYVRTYYPDYLPDWETRTEKCYITVKVGTDNYIINNAITFRGFDVYMPRECALEIIEKIKSGELCYES